MAKIVVLDDQREICETLQTRLTNDGHDVMTASAGEEAIDLGYLFQPDVLITDWNLESDYDGFEVVEAYKAAKADVQTIMITAYETARREAELRRPGIEIFATLLKPFSIELLANTVSKALANSQADSLAKYSQKSPAAF